MKRVITGNIIALFVIIMIFSVPVQAKTGWDAEKKHYYKEDGSKATGQVTIDGADYYFSKKGMLKKGWCKIGDNYYYYDRLNGKMVKGKKVDNIAINKQGIAKKTDYNVAKIKTMMTAQKLVKQITNESDSKSEKRKKCFEWVEERSGGGHYVMRHIFKEEREKKGWEMTYANDIFEHDKGDCISTSAALAFLLHECGYKTVYLCDDGDHGWVEINNKLFDTLFAKVKNYDTYYNGNYKECNLTPFNKKKI